MNGASQPPHLAITSMAESKPADLIARGRSLLGVQGDGDKNAICGAWGGKGNTDVLHMGRIHLEALHLAFENGKLEVKHANGSSAALDPDPPVASASQTSSAATAPPGKTVPTAATERALDTAAAANSSTSSGRPPKPGAAQAGSARKPPIGPAGPPHKSTQGAAATGGPSSPLRQPIPQATQDGQNFNELDELLRDEKWRVKAETLMNLVASHPQLSLSTSSTGASSKPGDKSEAGNVKRRLMVNRDVGIAELDRDNKFTAVNNGLQELLQTNAKALLGLPLMSLFRLEVPQGSLIETLKSNGFVTFFGQAYTLKGPGMEGEGRRITMQLQQIRGGARHVLFVYGAPPKSVVSLKPQPSHHVQAAEDTKALAVDDGETVEAPVKASAGEGKEGKEEQGQSMGRSLGDDAMAAVAALQELSRGMATSKHALEEGTSPATENKRRKRGSGSK